MNFQLSENKLVFTFLSRIMQMSYLGLSKPIRDPTHPEDPTGTDPKPADPTISVVGGGFSPHRNRLRRVGFGFYPPKPEKPEPTGEKPRFRQEPQIPARNPDSGEKNSRIQRKKPRSRPKNPDSGDISRRSDEILTGSGEISSNPMRLPPDLAKSHRFR